MKITHRLPLSLAVLTSMVFAFVAVSHVHADTATSSAANQAPDTAFLADQNVNGMSIMQNKMSTFNALYKARTGTVKALIDIELFDQAGKQLLQKSWDNVTLTTATSTFTLKSPKNLAPGVYTWKTAVFTPGWKQKINWYDSAATFAVLGTTTASENQRAVFGGLWQPKTTLKTGDSQYLLGNFTTLDQSVPTYLQFSLIDQDGNVVYEKGWNDTYLGYGYDTQKTVTSPGLEPGIYHWGIGLFSLNRKELKAWYDDVAPFTVASSTTTQ